MMERLTTKFNLGTAITSAMAVLIGGPALAKPSYQQVLQALQRGANVHVLTKLQDCQTAATKQPGPPIQTGYTINGFIAVPGKGIFFADTHQTINPAGQPDTEYVRYNLLPNNQLTIAVTTVTSGTARQQPTLICGRTPRFSCN
jgi:hypothetical protein